MTITDNPGLNINCPKCPKPMRYVTTVTSGDGAAIDGVRLAQYGLTPIYECHDQRQWRLDLDGAFRPQNP